jgi:tripartite-type tricarboxylate transporter receptor subunit TctC
MRVGLRLSVATLVVVALGLLAKPAPAQAQSYPSKPITIICAQPPGSGPDTMTRLFAEVMGRSLGQQILVVNKPGAAGVLAAGTVAQAAPDGYTLLVVLGAAHTIVPAIHQIPFDPINGFTFISLMYVSSGVLLVPPNSQAKDFAGLVALLKSKDSNASYGSPGLGSPGHLQGALLSERLGVKAKHVAYRGGTQLLVDLTGGLLDFAFLSTVQSIAPIEQKQVRGVAVGTKTRVKALPDLPTLAELGYGDVAVDSWFGIGGPKGMPVDVVAKLNAAMIEAAKDPTIVERAKADDVELLAGSQAEFQNLLKYDYDRLGAVVKRMGIKSE